mmetsp:Transcript_7863/g.19109  ORF Transcript_7863/g.19109 Transcript_7863/m.19109 type:complete len:267 (-) Transcript_7863:340-1140(-)
MCTTTTFCCANAEHATLRSSAPGCGCGCTSKVLYGKVNMRLIACASDSTCRSVPPRAENSATPRFAASAVPSGRCSKSARFDKAPCGSLRSISTHSGTPDSTEKVSSAPGLRLSGVKLGLAHTCSKAASMCVPSGNRFLAFFFSATLTKLTTELPAVTSACIGGVAAVLILFSSALSLSPVNGRCPSSISKYTTPAAHTSMPSSASEPVVCSGEEYAGVPKTFHASVIVFVVSCLEVPKSTMTTLSQRSLESPGARSMMLSGLMSR